MSTSNRLREWATPLTMGTFLLIGITGVLMFFKVNTGLIRPVHEWLSWLLVIGSVFHLAANWRMAVGYLKRPMGRAIMAVCTLLLVCTLLPFNNGGHEGGQQHRRGWGQAPEALLSSNIETVARAGGQDPAQAVQYLESQGLELAGKTQTIAEIASANHRQPLEIINLIFANTTAGGTNAAKL